MQYSSMNERPRGGSPKVKLSWPVMLIFGYCGLLCSGWFGLMVYQSRLDAPKAEVPKGLVPTEFMLLMSASFVPQLFSVAIPCIMIGFAEFHKSHSSRLGAFATSWVFGLGWLINNYMEVRQSMSHDQGTIYDANCVANEDNEQRSDTWCELLKINAYLSLALLGGQALLLLQSFLSFAIRLVRDERVRDFDVVQWAMFVLTLAGLGGFGAWAVSSYKLAQIKMALNQNLLLLIITPFLGVVAFLSLATSGMVAMQPNYMLMQFALLCSVLGGMSYWGDMFYHWRRLWDDDLDPLGLTPCGKQNPFIKAPDGECYWEQVKFYGVLALGIVEAALTVLFIGQLLFRKRWMSFELFSGSNVNDDGAARNGADAGFGDPSQQHSHRPGNEFLRGSGQESLMRHPGASTAPYDPSMSYNEY